MKKFLFKAKDWQGKNVKGAVEAQTQKGAVKLLKEERKLVVLSLKQEQKSLLGYFRSLLLMRVSLGQLAVFTRQLSTMIDAGLPLVEALDLISKQSKGKLLEVIKKVMNLVKEGEPLAVALEQEKKVFGSVYIASIKAGEEGGVLDKILIRLADNLEKKKEFVAKIKGAMIYPIIIIIGMVGVTIIMMVFVVPKMSSLYAEFDSDLPTPTRILMGTADFMANNILLLPVLLVLIVVGIRVVLSNEIGRRKFDEIKLKLPIIGPLLKTSLFTEMTRTLGTLLETGVHFVDALTIVAEASGNVIFKEVLIRAADNAEKGVPLSKAFKESRIFPPILTQMVKTGEETGKLGEVLSNVSRYFEAEAEEKVKGLTSAIEPLIMVVLGVGVGFLVIAIIMPIYNLTSQF